MTDETGAVVVNALVTLDDGLGHSYSARTDRQGQYHFDVPARGTYKLTATAEGFAIYGGERLGTPRSGHE